MPGCAVDVPDRCLKLINKASNIDQGHARRALALSGTQASLIIQSETSNDFSVNT